jgi:hypothetical protein
MQNPSLAGTKQSINRLDCFVPRNGVQSVVLSLEGQRKREKNLTLEKSAPFRAGGKKQDGLLRASQ